MESRVPVQSSRSMYLAGGGGGRRAAGVQLGGRADALLPRNSQRQAALKAGRILEALQAPCTPPSPHACCLTRR